MFSTAGGMGQEAQKLVKRLAQRMETTTKQRYADAVSHIRKRLSFELLKTTGIAVRGDSGPKCRNRSDDIWLLDLDLLYI